MGYDTMATAIDTQVPSSYLNDRQAPQYSTAPAYTGVQQNFGASAPVQQSVDGTTTGAGRATTYDKVATNILQAGDMIAGVATRAAENSLSTINSFANDRLERTVPSQRPPDVPESWKTRSSIVRSVTSVAAVGLTKTAELAGKAFFAVFKLFLALMYKVAEMRGHHVILTDEMMAIGVVIMALLVAYSRVYDAIEQATTAVFTTVIDNAHKYVSFKYGTHVSDLARELVGVAQDLVLSFLMWWRIAARAILSDGALREANKFLAPHVPPQLLRGRESVAGGRQPMPMPTEGLQQELHRD